MISIKKEDFGQLVPTKISVARKYVEQVSAFAKLEQHTTHKDIYDQLEAIHFELFNQELPFGSFDSMRKFIDKHRKEIY